MSRPRASLSSRLIRRSTRLLRANKKLLVFPLVAALLEAIPLFVEYWSNWGHFSTLQDMIRASSSAVPAQPSFSPRALATAFGYQVSALFLEVALFHECLAVFSGEAVQVRRGLTAALRRHRGILSFALLATLVGLGFEAVPRSAMGLQLLPMMVFSLLGFFVAPVLLRDSRNNPLRYLRYSAAILGKVWRPLLSGHVRLGLMLLVPLLFAALMVGIMVKAPLEFVPYQVIATAYIQLVGVVSQLYVCALYVFVTEGVLPARYVDAGDLDDGWSVKGGGSSRSHAPELPAR